MASFPIRALIVSAPYVRPNGYSNSITVEVCNVLAMTDGVATVEVREGLRVREKHVPVADLASTTERAATKLANHLAALLSRPLLPKTAGVTDGSAAATNAPACTEHAGANG